MFGEESILLSSIEEKIGGIENFWGTSRNYLFDRKTSALEVVGIYSGIRVCTEIDSF